MTPTQTPKQEVAALVDTWCCRLGIQKQALAAAAGFADYSEFSRAYLDQSRNLSVHPDAALRVVRAVSEGWPADRRCTADEALAFFRHTRLPFDRFEQARQLGLFPAGEWRRALQALLPGAPTPAEAPPATAADAWLQRLAALLAERAAPAPPVDPLGQALQRLAAMPAGPDEPLPQPAALPLPHRMPIVRSGVFGGRTGELRALAALAGARPAAHSGALVIAGIGGIGKTSLAAEFAHRYGQFFQGGVFWLSFGDPQSLPLQAAECAALGLAADPDLEGLGLDEQVRLVRRAWQEPIPRLLIFDNCEEGALLREWLPTSGGCRVIVTSRRVDWAPPLVAQVLALAPLDRAESVALLCRYRPDLAPSNADLGQVAEALGDLPLALHLAGSYLRRYRAVPALGSPAQLLADLLGEGPLEHEALQGIDLDGAAADHDPHVARTFARSLDRLDPADPLSEPVRAALARAACFAPGAPFSYDQLFAAMAGGPQGRFDRRMPRAVARLKDLGLLSDQLGRLVIHPLVAAFARRAIRDPEARADVIRALVLQSERVAQDEEASGARLLLPHLRALADETATSEAAVAAELCNLTALLLAVVGDLAGGLPYLERAHQLLGHVGQQMSRLGAAVLNNLGEWSRFLGRAEAARRFAEEALAVRRQILTPDDPDLAQSHSNLGELLREQGDLERAWESYRAALEIAERRLGPRAPLTLLVRNNMGIVQLARGEYGAARAQFALLLEAAIGELGAESLRVARTRLNLGRALQLLGELDGAYAHMDQALHAFRAQTSEENVETLHVRYRRALVAADRGARAWARGELQEVLALAEQHYGAEHPVAQRARVALEEVGG